MLYYFIHFIHFDLMSVSRRIRRTMTNTVPEGKEGLLTRNMRMTVSIILDLLTGQTQTTTIRTGIDHGLVLTRIKDLQGYESLVVLCLLTTFKIYFLSLK